MFLNPLVIPIPTLKHPFSNLSNLCEMTNCGQETLSYLGPNISNSLPVSLKTTEGLNTYKQFS